MEPYKEGLRSEWGIMKFNLDDLYVRFFRVAERRIAEMTGKGVACYVSNFSYLGDPSFVVMRKRFFGEFDKLWFDCMNGDSRETGKLTPEGKPDPSIFSTEYNRAGIRVETTIGLMVRRGKRDHKPTVRFRHFWGVTKRADLVASLDDKNFDGQYQPAYPSKSNRFSFRPQAANQQYLSWPMLVELAARRPFVGLEECRGGALIDIDRNALEKRMRAYYDPNVDWGAVKAFHTGLTEDGAGFDAKKARSKIQAAEEFSPKRIVRYAVRPFERLWCYYSTASPLWNRARSTFWMQCRRGNSFLISRFHNQARPEGIPFYLSQSLFDKQTISRNPGAFPILLFPAKANERAIENKQVKLINSDTAYKPTANLSSGARAYLSKLGIKDPDADATSAGLVWMNALSIGYSRAYLSENADGIRQDWPRIPLPDTRKALLASGELGEQVAALLNTEMPVKGVTSGRFRAEIKVLAVPARVGGGSLRENGKDLALTAGWGHAGKGGVTMPGKGKVVERDYTKQERTAIAEGAKTLGLSVNEAFARLGKTTCDVFLNDDAYWANIPCRVWEYHIGGYQVIKKWLSYRETKLLGRSLKRDEVREVQNMTRRLAALLLLEPALDTNYRRVRDHAYAWGDTKP